MRSTAAACAAAALARARARDERIRYIEDQLEWGFTPADIIADIGVKPASLWRFLHRHGRDDLAGRFDSRRTRDSYYRQGNTCADCGTPISDHATRCHPCVRVLPNALKRVAA